MSAEGLQWCRERILVPGNPLVASLPYAPASERDRILVLRTLIGELAAVPATVSDPGVAVSKLGWWREALVNPERQGHPALEAAVEADLESRLPPGAWDGLLAGIRSSLEPPRFEQFEELWSHCRAVGGAAAMLESRLVAPESISEPFMEIGAAGYLVRVVRDLGLDACQQRWQVPLDLQAGFRVDRQQVAAGKDSRAWRALVLEMLSRAHKCRQQALAGLEPAARWRHRHLLITAALDERLGRGLARAPGAILRRRILPGGLGNLLTAWRTARRLKRSK